MIDYLRRYLEVPTSDPNDLRKARLLNILAMSLAMVTVLAILLVGYLIISKVDGWENLVATFWSGLVFILGIWGILSLNRRGKVFWASTLFLLLIMFALTFANVEAISSGATQFYFVIPVLISSVLIVPAASFIVAAINSAIFIISALMMNLEPNFYIGVFGMFAIALVSWLAARTLENALSDLQLINIELDERVERRTQELADANTRLGQQAEELAAANEQLTELDALKSKFVSDVSHELRTPISNLAIYLEMLEEGNPLKSERYLAVLKDETTRLKTLVEDVLDLSRMEVGVTETVFELTDLNEIVQRVVTANQLRATAKGLDIKLEMDQNLPPVFADKDQLAQAINNLVGNAVNYTSDGAISVRTAQHHTQSLALIEISDTGMGIAPEDLPYVFERFYRGQQAGQSSIPGTGLGLAITKEIIERHEGRLDVNSQIGVGSTFTIHLPIALKAG